MGPTHFNPTSYPPVEPTDRPAKGELSLSGDKDRRIDRLLRRRRRQENPDADQFTHGEQETEETAGTDPRP